MNRIKILSEDVTNKIAAGEIIDRPVSIIKELVENAIDAESDKITVVLENGGKKKIQVIDNGIGMNSEDALLAFERHATSKIRNVEDITCIASMGFRGEAVPSIASVSKMRMTTKTEFNELAVQIDVEFGKIINVTNCSSNDGTDIIITRLFDNLPVRKKFLKTDQVELRHVINYIHHQALAFQNISFRLIHNGNERLNYPAVREKMNRYTAVLGSEFLKNDFLQIEDKTEPVSIFGFIAGLEEDIKTVGDFRYVFINGRYIRDRIIIHSINAAYEPFIKKYRIYNQGKTPHFIIFLKIKPELVDFNVHPAKLEVRFRDPHLVHSFVKNTITQTLLEYQEKKFPFLISDSTECNKDEHNSSKAKFESKEIYSQTGIEKTQRSSREMLAKKNFKNKDRLDSMLREIYQPNIFKPERKTQDNAIPAFDQKSIPSDIYMPTEEELVNPWQLHNSYILIQCEDGVVLIDQHAAHERILYEKFMHRMGGLPPVTQQLLFPVIIDIPPILNNIVRDLLDNNSELLTRIGFTLKEFSGDSIVINEIPAELSDREGEQIFKDILYQLQDEFEQTKDYRDSLAKAVSCKAAVKNPTKLDRKEMLKLINDLFACKVPWFCPHGRPVLNKITLNDLERKFKRI